MAKFKCPHCSQKINAPEELAGTKVDCPACNKAIDIPNKSSSASEKDPHTTSRDKKRASESPPIRNNHKNAQNRPGVIWRKPLSLYTDFLEILSSGKIIRYTMGRFIQAVMVIFALRFLFFWLETFGMLKDVGFYEGCALLLWQLFFPIAVLLCVIAGVLRGNQIVNFKNSEFIVTRIVATLVSTTGEIGLIFLGVMSVPAMLLTWLAAGVANDVLPFYVENGFFYGVSIFAMCWIIGFFAYVVSRWLRETTMAIYSIAHNVEQIEKGQKTNQEKDQELVT